MVTERVEVRGDEKGGRVELLSITILLVERGRESRREEKCAVAINEEEE